MQQIGSAERGALDRWALHLTLLLWLVPMIVIAVALFRDPVDRSLDPLYRMTVDAWKGDDAVYRGSGGFNYLPPAILVYLPFSELPQPFGQILWRLLAAWLLASGLWILMGLQERPRLERGMLLLSAMSLPLLLGALQTGQANALLAGILLHAAVGLQRGQMWRTAAWLTFGAALKPIFLAPLGLAVLMAPTLVIPLIVFGFVWLSLPFIGASAETVLLQYRLSVTNLTDSCAQVNEDRFTDINGLLRGFRVYLDQPASTVLRVLVGMLCAASVLAVRLRNGIGAASVRYWLVMSAGYLMLCNPMSEANSYVIFGIPMALVCWHWLGEGESTTAPRRAGHWFGWCGLALLLVMGIGSELVRPTFGNAFDLRVLPATALVLMLLTSADALPAVRRPPKDHTPCTT
jgi:hypothetical protein